MGGLFPFRVGVRHGELFGTLFAMQTLEFAHLGDDMLRRARRDRALKRMSEGEFVRDALPVAGHGRKFRRKLFEPKRILLAADRGDGGELLRKARTRVVEHRRDGEGVELVFEKLPEHGEGLLVARELVVGEERFHRLYLCGKRAARAADVSARFRACEDRGHEALRLFGETALAEGAREQAQPAHIPRECLAVRPFSFAEKRRVGAQALLQPVDQRHLVAEPALRGDAPRGEDVHAVGCIHAFPFARMRAHKYVLH